MFKVEDQHFFVKIVKNKMHFILVLKFFFLLSFLVFAEDFIYGLDDIPVYKNMRYVENSNVLFDKIDGRFVSSEMVGKYEIKEIKIFYNSVLPNLGWKKVKENIFERGTEFLEIKLESTGSFSTAQFSIYPK